MPIVAGRGQRGMTITSAYQSVSVTVAAIAVSHATVASVNAEDREPARTNTVPPPAPPPAAPAAADTVHLSRAARRADALMAAVDSSEDGAISEQEFTDGALALLRRGRSRHLQRRLAKLFDRVDANQDGSLSKEELTSALRQVSRHRHHRRPADVQAPSSNETTTASSAVVTSVTVVAVAVKQYAAAAQATAA